MSSFLDFINSVDIDTLSQISGVSRTLAGNIIAARPFDSDEDCLSVKGMGKAAFARLQSFAESQEKESETSDMVPVREEPIPATMQQTLPAREEVKEEDNFLRRLGRAFQWFLNALLKLFMLALLFTLVGLIFALVLPYIQRTFISPLEENTAHIKSMESEIADLQSQLDEMNSRVDVLEGSLEAHTQSIQKLEETQSALEKQLQENNDAVLLELKHEVMFTRILDVLARGRLYLSQSNFGLAKIDLQTARDLLAELQAEKNDVVLAKALERLDLTLGNLPDFPVIAAGDLEIAWQILISGEAPVPTATFTPTPVPVESATFTPPAADATFTPTAFPSVVPTSTP